MKYIQRNLFLAVVMLSMTAFFTSGCRENTIISAKAVPVIDNVHTFGDTPNVYCRTVYVDSALTSGLYTYVYYGLGTMNSDIIFGKSNSSIYFQVIPPFQGFTFGNLTDSISVDSAVLILPYTGYTFGDTTAKAPTQSFSVYRVTDTMSTGNPYYSFTQKNTEIAPLGTVSNVNIYHLKDSVKVLGVNKAPHLRIKLNDNLIQTLKTLTSNKTDSTNASFMDAFRGLAVVPADTNQGGKSIPYFRMDGSITDPYSLPNVMVFYHHTKTKLDTLTASFYLDISKCGKYNRIVRNYVGSPAQIHLQNISYNDSIIMIQNLPGTAADILIPGLDTNIRYKKAPVAINKAQLVITQITPSWSWDKDSSFETPQYLYPYRIDDNTNQSYSILDRKPTASTTALSFIDGGRQQITIGALTFTYYAINFPAEYQRAITEKWSKLHLRIVGPDYQIRNTYPGAYRLLGGGNNANSKFDMKVHIIYSILN